MKSTQLIQMLRSVALVVPLLIACSPGRADVTVTQGTGPGATSWPGTPLIATVSNPSAQSTIPESYSGASTTSYTQTFTVPTGSNFTLQSIGLYAGGGSGTAPSRQVSIHLFDLGGRVPPAPNSYTPGTDLLGGGTGLPITYVTQANGLLRLDFTGTDQVLLLAGRTYAFELRAPGGTTPINWLRTVTDSYPGGAAYRNRSWINGSSARDFGLAVYAAVNTDPVPPSRSIVDALSLRQRIDGFGAGAVFLDAGLNPLSDPQMDQLYGTGPSQFGLTLLRVRISPSGNFSDALTTGQRAVVRGARILATPWTPPAALKSNNNVVGGILLPSAYPAYVSHLNGFITAMATAGAPVSVVSLQNEPDIKVTYESCDWTPEELRVFSRDFAGGIQAPVMMPESFRFDHSFSDPTLNDPLAAANIDYIGGHLYGGTIRDYPLAHNQGKPTWMTEFLINDQSIGTAIQTGVQISDCLTVGNMSAYIWWKLIGNANGLLNASGSPQLRGYVMGQFSRFVRPGDFRVDVPQNASPLAISAFKDPTSGRFAIVVVNPMTVSETHEIDLYGLSTSTVTPWITSATQKLAPLAPIDVESGALNFVFPPLSIVTFSGISRPEITAPAQAGATVGVPFELQITASHEPTDFAATGLPPGLTIDGNTGLITGTPTSAGEFVASIAAANAGGMDSVDIQFTVLRANAQVTLAGLEQLYDGSPRHVMVTTSPAGLDVMITYDGRPEAPIYPGTYAVVATIDDPNYTGNTTAILEVDAAATVRILGSVNGGIDASIQVLGTDDITLNGSAWIAGDLLVAGTPSLRLNGRPMFVGTIEGPGASAPDSHRVTLNGDAALRHLVVHIDPKSIPVVEPPVPPSGTSNVTLNGNAGVLALPPGSYGSVIVNGGSGLVLGVAGSTTPAIYHVQNLTLNSGSTITLAGPVELRLNNGLSINSQVAFSHHDPSALVLKIASGGLVLNGDVMLPANVLAPTGTVTLNGSSTLRGLLKADRLIVNGQAEFQAP